MKQTSANYTETLLKLRNILFEIIKLISILTNDVISGDILVIKAKTFRKLRKHRKSQKSCKIIITGTYNSSTMILIELKQNYQLCVQKTLIE